MRAPLRPFALACSLPCLTLMGCLAAQRHVTPEATLTSFAEALDRGDLNGAYALLSDDARKQVSISEFKRRIAANATETRELVKAAPHRVAVRTQAHVELSNGSVVALVKRGDGWQLEGAVIDFYSQATPRDALDSFIRAVERSRWDILLELMPEADRQGLDAGSLGSHLKDQQEELTRMVALLKASREAPIEVVGDRATMPYGESFTARFVCENERWKIEDPE